jgi:hypothetical protein
MKHRFSVPKQFLALARLEFVDLYHDPDRGQFGLKRGNRILFNVKRGAVNRYRVIKLLKADYEWLRYRYWYHLIGDTTKTAPKKVIETGNISKAIEALMKGKIKT